jgi:hypothetical protein
VVDENGLGEDIQRIRDRLRAMRVEREAAMNQLAESRETAEAHRQVRVEGESVRDRSTAPDSSFFLSP